MLFLLWRMHFELMQVCFLKNHFFCFTWFVLVTKNQQDSEEVSSNLQYFNDRNNIIVYFIALPFLARHLSCSETICTGCNHLIAEITLLITIFFATIEAVVHSSYRDSFFYLCSTWSRDLKRFSNLLKIFTLHAHFVYTMEE